MDTPIYELLPTTSMPAPHSHPPPRKRRARLRTISLVLSIAVVALLVVSFVLWAPRTPLQNPSKIDDAALNLALAPPTKRIVARFSVSSTIIRHLDKVTVSLEYADDGFSPQASDWVGVYCLEQDDAELPTGAYLDYRSTSGHATQAVEFGPLVNMRCALQFKLIAEDGVTVLATAPTLVNFRDGAAEPTQLHLAMGNAPNEMRMQWTSGDVTKHRPRVRFGNQADSLDSLNQEANATWTTYDADDMCAQPATERGPTKFRDPGMFYDALIANLQPDATYVYQVGSDAAWSAPRSFHVPPFRGASPSNGKQPLSLFVFADLMSTTSATQDFRSVGGCGTTLELMEQDLRDPTLDGRRYAGLIHVGDLSYAAGKTFVWDHFGSLIEPVASRIPYMVSVGNHDFGYLEGRASNQLRAPPHTVFDQDETKGYDAHGECGVPTEKRFHMPENGNGILWYSFEIGLTHHTVLSGEHDFAVGSAMHTWLLHDLQGVDRTKTPWLFVHIHRPLYCSVAFGGDFIRSLYLRDHLENVFAQYRVDVVFSGHYHSYERTCPVYDDHCYYGKNGQARGPVHIMVGSGGANVDTYGHYGVGWSESAKMAYGYGRIHVFNATHALFEFVENQVRGVTDSAWIVTDHAWTLHTTWRWRRVVMHPTLGFMVSAVVASVLSVLGYALGRHVRHRDTKRR